MDRPHLKFWGPSPQSPKSPPMISRYGDVEGSSSYIVVQGEPLLLKAYNVAMSVYIRPIGHSSPFVGLSSE